MYFFKMMMIEAPFLLPHQHPSSSYAASLSHHRSASLLHNRPAPLLQNDVTEEALRRGEKGGGELWWWKPRSRIGGHGGIGFWMGMAEEELKIWCGGWWRAWLGVVDIEEGCPEVARRWVTASWILVEFIGTSCSPIIDINEESLDEVSANLTSKKVLSDNCLSQLESRLDVGQLFSCPNEAYKLYVKYAISKGFSVRKGKNYTFWRFSEIRAKAFLCNKQGESKGKCDKENENKQYHNLVTIEKCEAMLYIAREKDVPWKVIKFIKEHTHELAAHDEIHLLKSARKISESKAGTLESMVNAGIKAIHAFNYMEKECGGPEKVGFLKKDVYNLINQIRNSRIAGGDCQQVFNHFQSRVTENSGFYWDADFDQTGRMYNFFWRDNRCSIDYEYFGDIVIFDTTYLTNRYQLICAPFIGINHHGQNIMFGCAFLSDEKTSSFEWLFKAFLKAMGNKHPQTIFTDQCQAMSNGIEKVFSHTRHRLCQWHINKNAPSHFGSLNNEPLFKTLWKKCMKYCESKTEFEETWHEMVELFKLQEHRWFNHMYGIREKWSTAFYRDEFNCGLKSTSRSESANSSLKEMCNRSTSLYHFVIGFEEVVRKWRANEKEEDFRCKNGRPFVVVRNNPLLTQASKVYTYTIYMKFQKELQEGTMGHAIVDVILLEGVSRMYKVMSHGIDKRIRIVVFDKSSEELKCSCRDLEESEMVFVNSTMRYVYEIVMQSKQHLEARKILKDALGNVELQLEDLRNKGLMSYGDEEINTREVNEGNVMHVHDPPVKSKKICNEKHQSHWDIKEKKKRQSNATTSSKDIFFFALSVSLSLIVIIKYKTILLLSGRSKKNVHGSIQLYERNINVKMVCDASQGSQQSTVAEHFTSSIFQAYTPTPILRLNCDNVSIVQHDMHSQV
ncbi:hypothetical protein BUALT_Bualt01G0195600 [Buddleja alternifolia]|uniref:Protein FAR1-RELATED SEQUENCE n=1 Tax=Buddleja alternifolia TaxID=168488 RepID=A0AAV6Y9J4_9LAMI|nr:hypothetical protein BUALT_Bualt01G0195600 [Buddleja alternifolia]